MDHTYLEGSGQVSHAQIDKRLPTDREKSRLAEIAASAPENVSGARDNPEAALKNLLAALEDLGLINDNTSAS